jgi:integrase
MRRDARYCIGMKNTANVTACKHPRYSHRVRFPGPNGKRIDRFFSNETDALAFAKEQNKETGEVGTAFGSISETERAALAFWRQFVKEAAPAPPSLLSVLQDYKATYIVAKGSVTVNEAIKQFVDQKQTEGASQRYTDTLKTRLGRLGKDHGEQLVSSITPNLFFAWINNLRVIHQNNIGEKLSLVTRHNLTRSLSSFFGFCIERGWMATSPIPTQKRSKSRSAKLAMKKAPEIMLPADIARFMNATAKFVPRATPFWALKFFAGIRDAEAGQIDWSMIDMDGGKIHLPAKISKTGDERTMKIEANLDAWLRPHAKTSGPICMKKNTRKADFGIIMDKLAKRDANGAIVEPFKFPHNAARHCFGTYHLFHFRNAGETALQLGHKSNPAMLHEHYKNASAEKHASAFWKITPAIKAAKITNIETGRKTA